MQKRRRRRSRSQLSSRRLERGGLRLSRSCPRDMLRSWTVLTQAASGLQNTACRMERTRLPLRRSLLDTRRWGRRGLRLSRSCQRDTLCTTIDH